MIDLYSYSLMNIRLSVSWDQATDRAYRISQENIVQVFKLVTCNSGYKLNIENLVMFVKGTTALRHS